MNATESRCMPMPKLKNPRYERFAHEIVAGAPTPEAYANAGFKPNRANGSRLKRTNALIAARIAELQGESAERAQVSAERVLVELKRLAFSDLRNYFEEDADGKLRLRKLTDLPAEASAALSKLQFDEWGNPMIDVHAKLPALRLLAEYCGLVQGSVRPDGEPGGQRPIINLYGRPGGDTLGDVLREIDGRTRGLAPHGTALAPTGRPDEPK
jgi:hypothetical protein